MTTAKKQTELPGIEKPTIKELDVLLEEYAVKAADLSRLRVRRFVGIEKDAHYAEVARERLEAESRGLTLRAARAGQTSIFDVMEPKQ